MAGAREISSRDCEIARAVTSAQAHMLDLASRKYGFTRKVLALETGISESTLKMYEQGTAMPLATFVRIIGVKDFPNELASLVLEPSAKVIEDASAEETDFDDMARAAINLLARYVDARHPSGPGGVRIVHSEEEGLRLAAAGLDDQAGKVAA